jgi:mono/diheme cytochrome c family protein
MARYATAAPTARAQDGAGPDGGPTTLDGVFTPTQAERGRKLFADACADCHTTDRFTGQDFRPSWSRAPVSTLFTVLRTQMPFDNPGSLDRDEYAAIVAYLFELNGLPPGDSELPASSDSLRTLTIRFPPSDSGG